MCHRNNLGWDLWKYWVPKDAECRLPSMPSTLMAGRMKFSTGSCGRWEWGQGTVRGRRRTLPASVSLMCALKVHHGLAKIHLAWPSSSPEGGTGRRGGTEKGSMDTSQNSLPAGSDSWLRGCQKFEHLVKCQTSRYSLRFAGILPMPFIISECCPQCLC